MPIHEIRHYSRQLEPRKTKEAARRRQEDPGGARRQEEPRGLTASFEQTSKQQNNQQSSSEVGLREFQGARGRAERNASRTRDR